MAAQHPSTLAVHAGEADISYHSVTMPVVHSAPFAFATTAELISFMAQKEGKDNTDRVEYGRYGNPTVRVTEKKIAALEGGEDALLLGSGMAAVTTLFLAYLSPGDHLVITNDVYRRSRLFGENFLRRMGIQVTFVAPQAEAIAAALRPATKMIFSETPTNPFLRVVDLAAVAALGRKHDILTVIDATFATPVNLQPLAYGIDLVLHSATKYLAGHNDLLAGAVVGSVDRLQPVRELRGSLGNVLAPGDAYLLLRGLKTLALRVWQQNENGLALARYLAQHPKVTEVFYPGLPNHPDHALARQQMRGFGGVVSFTLAADLMDTAHFVDALQISAIAPSLGGVESLVSQPALVSYYNLTPAERAALRVSDNLVRFSAGIEESDDLIADFEQALAKIPD